MSKYSGSELNVLIWCHQNTERVICAGGIQEDQGSGCVGLGHFDVFLCSYFACSPLSESLLILPHREIMHYLKPDQEQIFIFPVTLRAS